MDKTFRVKLSAWYEALEAYKALESAMACKIEEQYDMLARLENVWYGKSAGAFQSKYRELLETGTYAESYKHIGEIRMLLEEGLPELVCMAAKCEQIPEQLACDEYVVPITRYAYSPHYNAGHVMLDDDYAPFVDQMCDRIQEVNQEARNLLDDIMAQCGDLIDFSAEKLENETVYRKINRVGNYKRAFDEYALAVRQFDENMQTDLSFVSTRYFDRNNALTYGQPGEQLETVQPRTSNPQLKLLLFGVAERHIEIIIQNAFCEQAPTGILYNYFCMAELFLQTNICSVCYIKRIMS